jgi:hypothetical protein
MVSAGTESTWEASALVEPPDPTAVICNATCRLISCTMFLQPDQPGMPSSTRHYNIAVGSCLYSCETPQAIHIDYPAMQLNCKQAGSVTASSASPSCWVLTEEAGTVQARCAAGTSPPLCWHIPGGTASYDARDQATIEAWQHDAATRREGVKHITRLCSEAAAAAVASTSAARCGPDPDDSEQPTNGSQVSHSASAAVTPDPLPRLLTVLRSLPRTYTAADFTYTPFLTTLEVFMRSPLPQAQLHEVAKILVDRGLGHQCPALLAGGAAPPPKPDCNG